MLHSNNTLNHNKFTNNFSCYFVQYWILTLQLKDHELLLCPYPFPARQALKLGILVNFVISSTLKNGFEQG
jgi:hypothetical protein